MRDTQSEKGKKKRAPRAVLKRFLTALAAVIAVMAVLCCAAAAVSRVGIESNRNFIASLEAVKYDAQLEPDTAGGYCTFITDEDFKILQLSDVHIGAGFMSIHKDQLAINAVASMVAAEAPDLVVVTGDIAYPVPFQAGTLNNKYPAVLFAELMEQLGVYWCLTFGNHDTEAYSYYTREDIAAVYESGDYPHCLFQSGSEAVDGAGNYIINVKNTAGKITESLIMLDSHAYLDGDALGVLWKYDCVHENQVEWYKAELEALAAENGGSMPKSLVFLHMPLQEYRDAWYEYTDAGYQDTEDTQYIYGKAGEQNLVVYCSEENNALFDTALRLGSTQGFFCGHDHLNNFSVTYKGVRLTYSYTVDYLAYTGIMKYGLQRGCTVIHVRPDSSFDCSGENYYQDKYETALEKETVLMEDYYGG